VLEVGSELLGDLVGEHPGDHLDAGRLEGGDTAPRDERSGSRRPITTRPTPAATMASVHGGVRP